jgi:hypothetical protein
MRAAVHEGPVFGSALFVSVPSSRARAKRAAGKAMRVTYSRRPIGMGPRAILVTNPACKASARVLRAKKPAARRAVRRTPLYAGLLGSLLFSAAAMGLSYAVDSPRTLMSRADYLQARQAIAAEARSALGKCRAVEIPARDVCRAQARAGERIGRAELDARYHGTVSAAADARLARVKARFDVERARCDALDADSRSQCLQSARVDEAREAAAARPAAT